MTAGQPECGAGEPGAAERLSFIETQFPVSLLSKESYKERSAKNSQTLTPLGKWWGRKPLIMVRAVILGLLMPASSDSQRDRETFLALLTMDSEGLWLRKNRNIGLEELHGRLTPKERRQWFMATHLNRPTLRRGIKPDDRRRLQRLAFDRMSYDERLKYCSRPEHIAGPSAQTWQAINEHLGTDAASLSQLIRELGARRFGHMPRVGDAFCGGGSVPFEAARIGCDSFGSDLNPVAALLTWAALNIVGGDDKEVGRVREAQASVVRAVDRQITVWRIEHNDFGWRAEAFLYCAETRCPECGWEVPLSPSWVVGKKPRTVAQLVPMPTQERFSIDVLSAASAGELRAAHDAGTAKDSRLECPNQDCGKSVPLAVIRSDRRGDVNRRYGLRKWESNDVQPRPGDVFWERLYCIRWRLPRLDELLWAEQRSDRDGATLPEWVSLEYAISALSKLLNQDHARELAALRERDWLAEDAALIAARHDLKDSKGRSKAGDIARLRLRIAGLEAAGKRRDAAVAALTKAVPRVVYRSVEDDDLEREAKAPALLRENFTDWQCRGFLPSRAIAPGAKTNELIRTRGWAYWHHLFTPRQLTLGLLSSHVRSESLDKLLSVASVLGLSRCVDYNSKLCRWHTRAVGDKSEQTFSNQAFNTMSNFSGRGLVALQPSFLWISTRTIRRMTDT